MQLRHLSEQRRKEIASLARSKGRAIHNQMLIEGWRSVKSALLAGAPLTELLVTERILKDEHMVAAIEAVGPLVLVYEVSEKTVRQISSVETSQGIFAVAGIKRETLAQFEQMKTVLALDGVQDPGNVGTIIRTAAWFGIDGVMGGAGTADFFNPKVIRASMGGLWDLRLLRVSELADTLELLKEAGMQSVCADLRGTPLAAWQPNQRTMLVIGGEANGVSEEVKSKIDGTITIPGAQRMQGAESLNAAVAAGIIMHHWRMGPA